MPGRLYRVKVKYCEMKEYSNYIDKVENIIRVKIIDKIINNYYYSGHVLVFLAGVDEINTLLKKLNMF